MNGRGERTETRAFTAHFSWNPTTCRSVISVTERGAIGLGEQHGLSQETRPPFIVRARSKQDTNQEQHDVSEGGGAVSVVPASL